MSAVRPLTRAELESIDGEDPLAPVTGFFELPDGVIYLDGNSLGPVCRQARRRLVRTVADEWRRGLIRSWNAAGWIDMPTRIGDRIGALIGAAPGQVVVTDQTSLNLFKVVAAAAGLRADRRVILSSAGNFPSDLYVLQGVSDLIAGHELRLLPAEAGEEEVEAALGDEVGVLVLTHVDFRTARLWDIARLTEAAHRAGALVVWDLSHTVGAMPVQLDAVQADFAVGCTYKYLNAGPGAPGFLYVAARHQSAVRQPLTAWLGHARPFAFETGWEPAPDIRQFLTGTPQVLGMATLAGALEVFDRVSLAQIREKSLALSELFIRLVDEGCPTLQLVSPREPELRGSHLAYRHPSAYAVMRALIDRGVIGDFRAPDLARFGITPLFLTRVDVWDAVEVMRDVLDSGLWRHEAYQRVETVT